MKRTFLGTLLRPAEFGSDDAKTCHVTGASVGDPGARIEHFEPGQGSSRPVLLHAGPEDSAATVNAHHGPHVAQVGRLAVLATPALGKDAALEGEIREVSVVMADLRGFTAFCERVPPDRMHRVLNEYLTAMIDVILGQQGHVQDFIGDGILGVFGAPGQGPDHGWHAVLSAVEMQIAIRQLGTRWRREGGTAFALGVAVHAGQAFAGEVGSPKHRKYAVVGDPVNTVARLEEVNRNLGTEIVVSGEVLALVRDRVDVHPRGSFAVRGRSHPVEVFELLGVVTLEGGRQHLPAPVTRIAMQSRSATVSSHGFAPPAHPPA
jgi:class 3 adenylate cyclase